jgi:hypothetical protein
MNHMIVLAHVSPEAHTNARERRIYVCAHGKQHAIVTSCTYINEDLSSESATTSYAPSSFFAIDQHRSQKVMSSATAAKTEGRQQETSINTQDTQQDTAGTPLMSVLYLE